MKAILFFYRLLFAWPIFFRLNRLLYRCSLAGLGVLNFGEGISGETRFLRRLLAGQAAPVVIDVGANVGDYSRQVLAISPQASVHAFEPHPVTFGKLVARLGQGKVHAVNAAAGSAPGTMTLYDYAAADGSEHASLYREVIEGLRNAPVVGHEVRVLRLGDYLEEKGIGRIDLLKIDTEGNELSVLQGVGEALAQGRIAAIHFEFNEMNVASRTFFRDFWNLLPNYEFYRLLPQGMVKIASYSPVHCEIFAYQNIVALLKQG